MPEPDPRVIPDVDDIPEEEEPEDVDLEADR